VKIVYIVEESSAMDEDDFENEYDQDDVFNELSERHAVSFTPTLVTEKISLYVPWIIQNFCKKTIYDTHSQLLENLKMVLESGLHKGW